jgi:hypothetical protein
MPNAAELDPDALKVALNATDILLRFRDYTPPGGRFVMLLGKFRDDLREAPEMEAEEPADAGGVQRGPECPQAQAGGAPCCGHAGC